MRTMQKIALCAMILAVAAAVAAAWKQRASTFNQLSIAVTEAAQFGAELQEQAIRKTAKFPNGTRTFTYNPARKDLAFETQIRGDSLSQLLEDFGYPQSAENRKPFLRDNPDVKSHRRNWIFKLGRTYRIPAEFRDVFVSKIVLLAENTKQRNYVEKEIGTSNNTSNASANNFSPWWLLGLGVPFAVAAAAPPVAKRIAIRHYPVEGLPRIAEPIESETPDAPQKLDQAFRGLAERINSDISRTGPMEFMPVAEQGGVITTVQGARPMLVEQVLDRIGPIYRGRMKKGGLYSVRDGNSLEWKQRIAAGGEYVYRSRFRVRTSEGGRSTEKETDLFFLQVCCNDLKFSGMRYLFGSGVIGDWELMPGTDARPRAEQGEQARAATPETEEAAEEPEQFIEVFHVTNSGELDGCYGARTSDRASGEAEVVRITELHFLHERFRLALQRGAERRAQEEGYELAASVTDLTDEGRSGIHKLVPRGDNLFELFPLSHDEWDLVQNALQALSKAKQQEGGQTESGQRVNGGEKAQQQMPAQLL